jgi:hypothetical protein
MWKDRQAYVSNNLLLFNIHNIKLNAEPTHSCIATNDVAPSAVLRSELKTLYRFGNNMFHSSLKHAFRTFFDPVNI